MGLFFSISVLVISLFLIVIFFLRRGIKNNETKIFSGVLLILVFMLLMEVCCGLWFGLGKDIHSIIFDIFSKARLISYVLINILLTKYIVSVCMPTKKNHPLLFYLSVIVIALVAFLPISFKSVDSYVSLKGIGVKISYCYSALCLLYQLILCLIFVLKIEENRLSPFYTIILLGCANVVITVLFPYLGISGYLYFLSIMFMYLTIESPDVKMIDKYELARVSAEQAVRTKNDFLSKMSLEIRTSLTSIVGLTEDIVTYKDQVPTKVLEDSVDIQNSSKLLIDLVNKVLDTKAAEKNGIELNRKPYILKEEIDNMCNITKLLIGNKEIDFKLEISENVPYEVIGDKDKVIKVINNILTNAIEYTEKGHIKLSIDSNNDLKRNKTTILVICEDTGRGISKENLDKIFGEDNFSQIEANNRKDLVLTKSLVNLMGGNISVESEVGKGSIFSVEIPQKISMFEFTNDNEVASDVMQNAYVGKRILIVDDNKINIKVAKRALADFNFDIDECYDGNECLEKVINGNEYDLILLDIMMPNKNGEETIKELRKNTGFSIPVIALTADAVSGAKEKYISEGFIDYISKPFSREQIKEKLDQIFILNKKQISTKLDVNYLKENHIDITQGMSLYGNIEMYNENLYVFYEELKERLDKLKKYKEEENMKKYSMELYSLRRDFKYVGALDIVNKLYAHEIRAKQNDIKYVFENYDDIVNRIKIVADIIKTYLGC